MRVFQNIGLYPNYLPKLYSVWAYANSYQEMKDQLIADRFGGVHYLLPVIEKNSECFFTAGDNERLQKKWAVENGLSETSNLNSILYAQIEEHKSEIFYNMDPVRFDDRFLQKLPGCIRRTIAWRAAPSGDAKFLKHDLIVNNYPALAKHYEEQGARTDYFTPSHDPEMDRYAANNDRPIDILFIGGYTRHHMERAAILEAASLTQDSYNVVFNLDVSRATRIAETPAGWFGQPQKLRRPKSIRKISERPVFGLDMYRQISRAKIVLNGKVDIAGNDRGNMRLWETLGCGAVLLTDKGNYPPPMEKRNFFATYSDRFSLIDEIESLLSPTSDREVLAKRGHDMIRTVFSKQEHWDRFVKLCE